MDTPGKNNKDREQYFDDVLQRKADRISNLFKDLGDTSSLDRSSYIEDETSPRKSQPRSQDEFSQRVSSFHPGLWTVNQISPLECARWGWKLLEKDVLECVTCREVICAMLPNRTDKLAYEKFFGILKDRLETSHSDACGWRYNPCPREFVEPLIIDLEELRNMKNSVQTLATLNSALPLLKTNRITAILGVDDEVINGLLKSNDGYEEAQHTAVLLVLCGWSKGQGAYLRCTVCRRLVGLWSLITLADEFKKQEASKSSSNTNSRKRKLSENSDSGAEASEDKRITRQSPRKLKSQETGDMPTPKRMKTRSQDSKMDVEESEEKQECLLITSPSTQVEKVEKKYFDPLDEHRHWCPWIAKIEDEFCDTNEDSDPPKGFCIVVEQVRAMLQMSDQRKSASRENYVENVDGLRRIRNLLDEISSD